MDEIKKEIEELKRLSKKYEKERQKKIARVLRWAKRKFKGA